MIHPGSRRLVGRIPDSGWVDGHAVLLTERWAVTCAHVLGTGPDRPDGPVRIGFPGLGRTATGRVRGWRPYDPGLARGSDLALLELRFDGDGASPLDCRAGLEEGRRPYHGQPVATLDYLGPLPTGNLREGAVLDADGDMISLDGEHFVVDGMSGTGLFYKDPGERLIGLVSGFPETRGQTTGYAIPVDEIAALLADEMDRAGPLAAADGRGEAVAVLIGLLLKVVSPNLQPLLEELRERVEAILVRPRSDWREEDLTDLADLQSELQDSLAPLDDGSGSPISAACAKVLRTVLDLLATVADVGRAGVEVPLTSDMADFLESARRDIEDLLKSEHCPASAIDALEGLRCFLDRAKAKVAIRFGRLSHRTNIVRERVGDAFAAGARALMALIGCRPELAPSGAIFIDVDAPWSPEMVVLPACPDGFLMGSPEDERERSESEGPQHRVRIASAFALSRFALTFGAFDHFCAETGRETPGDADWGRESRPVINVSWEDAVAWCAWMSGRCGSEYRLPSEAEWEYACRGDESGENTTPFCPAVANGAGQAGRYLTTEEANFDGNHTYNGSPEGEYRERTLPVGHSGFRPNGFGLWQMHGNVFEWVADGWHESYEGAPADGSVWLSGEGGDRARRVLRGGSWFVNPKFLRSARRNWYEPDDRVYDVGFRPARTLVTP